MAGTFLPQEVIRAKRDGATLAGADIRALIGGLADGSVTREQAAAFAMAVFFRGMDMAERVALTKAMRDSGAVLAWDLPGPVVDKHSTGGVGDNVSLMLAPALAACGAFVPMISGRGLGHTGGTLDKLDSVPGYATQPDAETFRRVVREAGCAIIGQTADLAPADRTLYAIRDVTGTVESLDLITASILSKKLAAGLDALVLDVKCGSGAFMARREDADALAGSLVGVANGAGCRASALLTDMSEPLASAAGNALEVANACAFLSGHEIDPRLWDVTVALGGEALALAGLAPDAATGRARIADALQSGRAAERFDAMCRALGGPGDLVENFTAHLPTAPVVQDVATDAEGVVAQIDTRALGVAVIGLGGGRARAEDRIDPRVGFDRLAGLGVSVGPGAPLGRVHAADAASAARAAEALRGAYRIGDAAPDIPEPVLGRVGPPPPGANGGG
ncbi:thymidine phosphorylase [Rubrimonas cliftonensis]|uniref:Thymidine phosphorylase n=1 Tax=Rubrimonas cliftonensis TaxID=89524 RepID=A0A1H4AL87_9RHOB|nr:thymidine phosphorylase [Rubrimonas cliftonensis]SEA36412.1 thymidine phosphorylase [Rubrimonas cliftonensis]